MSYYQTIRIDQAIRSETDRLADYRATGHFQSDATPDFRLEVQPVHAPAQAELFDLTLDELQRVRWALALTPEQYTAATAPAAGYCTCPPGYGPYARDCGIGAHRDRAARAATYQPYTTRDMQEMISAPPPEK